MVRGTAGDHPVHQRADPRRDPERYRGARQKQAQAKLLDWLETELPAFFAGRILPIDEEVADRWGRLLASARRPVPAIDSLLAATALTHGLTLVTRNVGDFLYPDLEIIDPWETEGM